MDIANLRAIISVETSRFRAGMAGVEGQLRGTEAQLRAVDTQAKATGAAMATTGRQSALMAGTAKLAKVGLLGIGFAAYEGYKRMKEGAQITALTANQVRLLGKSAAVTAEQVHEQASAMALATGVSREHIQAAMNTALSFKSVGTNAALFGRVMRDSMDASAKSGKDMNLITRALARAMDDPAKGMGLMARAAIYFTGAQKDAVKTMMEHNQVAKAQAYILGVVESKSQGAAARLAKTPTGAINRMKEALGQMSEEVAQSLVPAILTIGPPLISLVRSLAPAFKMLAEGVAKIAQPFAALLSAITKSRAGTIALTSALGVLVALGVGAKIASWGKGIGEFIGSLSSGVSRLAGVSTAAAAVEAEATAAGGAMGAMGAEGAGMATMMGGPVVWGIAAATVATVALGAVIGGDLVSSFMGSGSAADQYAAAIGRTKQATTDLHTATAALPGALDNLAGAHRRVAAARAAAAAAPGDLDKQAALKQSIADESRARQTAITSIRNTATANRTATASVQAQAEAMVRAKGIYPQMIAGTSQNVAATKRYDDAVRKAAATIGNTTAWKQAQADYASMAAKLQPLGGKYAVVAKEASKLSNMKPGPEATALAATIGKQLDAIAAKANGAKPKVKVDANTDAAKSKVGDLQNQVNTLTSKSWTVQVQVQQSGSLPSSMGGSGGKKGKKGKKGKDGKIINEVEQQTGPPTYDTLTSNNAMLPQNMSAIAGNFQQQPGILDLIASLRGANAGIPSKIADLTKQRDKVDVTKSGGPETVAAYNAQINKLNADLAAGVPSETAAANAARALMIALGQQGNVTKQVSALANAHKAVLAASGSTEKAAALKTEAHAKATLLATLQHLHAAKGATIHTSATALLALAHGKSKTAIVDYVKSLASAAQKLQGPIAAALKTVEDDTSAATPSIDDFASSTADAGDAAKAADANMSRAQGIVQRVIDKVRAALTPTEALIKSLQDAGQTQDLSNNVSDAQDALARAQEFGDSTQIRDAQRALTSASRAQQIAQLQPQADAERQSVNDYLDSLDPGAIAQSLIDSGGNVSNITFTLVDNTLTGLTRDQTDNLARQLGPALARQVGVTI